MGKESQYPSFTHEKKCSKTFYFVSHQVLSCIIRNISFSLFKWTHLLLLFHVCMWHSVCGGFWDILSKTWTIYYTCTLYRGNILQSITWNNTEKAILIYKLYYNPICICQVIHFHHKFKCNWTSVWISGVRFHLNNLFLQWWMPWIVDIKHGGNTNI